MHFFRARRGAERPPADSPIEAGGTAAGERDTASATDIDPPSAPPAVDVKPTIAGVEDILVGGRASLRSMLRSYVQRPCKALLRNAELLIWALLFGFVIFVIVRHRSPPTQAKPWNKIGVHRGLDYETRVRRAALGLPPDAPNQHNIADGGDTEQRHEDLGWHGDRDFLDQVQDGSSTEAHHVDLDHVPTPEWKQQYRDDNQRPDEDPDVDDDNMRRFNRDLYGDAFVDNQRRRSDFRDKDGSDVMTDQDAADESERMSLGENDPYPYSEWTEPPIPPRRRVPRPPPPLSLSDIKKHIRRLEMNEEFSLVKLRLRELEELKKQRSRLMDEYDFADEQDAFREREREWQRMKWNEQEKKFHRWLQRARMHYDPDDAPFHPPRDDRARDVGGEETPQSCPGMFPIHPFVPYAQHARTIPDNTFAYVTYVSSAEFVPAAATLLHSIAVSGSQYARAVVITEDISQSDRATLSLLGQLIVIEKIPSPRYIDNARYRETFTKLRVWQLAMFKRILYVDTDVVVTRNMDDLFDISEWAVPMDAEQNRYSTGMMVCDPSLETFDTMMEDLKTTTTSMELPDLLFLKSYFDNPAHHAKINIIPRWYQVYQEEFGSQYQTYLTNRKQKLTIFDTRIHGIHYPGAGKPWGGYATKMAKYKRHFCHWQDAAELQYEPQFLWYVHHELMLRSLTKAKSSSLFEYENFGEVITLKSWVEDRKKKEEEERSWQGRWGNNWNSPYGPYGKSSSNYYGKQQAPSTPYGQHPASSSSGQQGVDKNNPNAFTWAYRDNRWVKVPLNGATNSDGVDAVSMRNRRETYIVNDVTQVWYPTQKACRFVVTADRPRVLSTQEDFDAERRDSVLLDQTLRPSVDKNPLTTAAAKDSDATSGDSTVVSGKRNGSAATGGTNFWGHHVPDDASSAAQEGERLVEDGQLGSVGIGEEDKGSMAEGSSRSSNNVLDDGRNSGEVAEDSSASEATNAPPSTIDPKEESLRRKSEQAVRDQLHRPAADAYQDDFRKGKNPYSNFERTQRRLQQLPPAVKSRGKRFATPTEGQESSERLSSQPARRAAVRRPSPSDVPAPTTSNVAAEKRGETALKQPARQRSYGSLPPTPMQALLKARSRRPVPATSKDQAPRLKADGDDGAVRRPTPVPTIPKDQAPRHLKADGDRPTEVKPTHFRVTRPSNDATAFESTPDPTDDIIKPPPTVHKPKGSSSPSSSDASTVSPADHNRPTRRVDSTAGSSSSSTEVDDVLAQLHNPPPKRPHTDAGGVVSPFVIGALAQNRAHLPSGGAPADEDASGSSSSSSGTDAKFMALLNALVDEEQHDSTHSPIKAATVTLSQTAGEQISRNRPAESRTEILSGATVDFSLVPPLVVSLPQEWAPNPTEERYEWVVSWCTKTKLRPMKTTSCGKASHVSQFSLGLCRTNFDESFEVLPLFRSPISVGPPTPRAGDTANHQVAGDNVSHLTGVVFRSKVTLEPPLRAKWFEVAVRCDPSMEPHAAALEEDAHVPVVGVRNATPRSWRPVVVVSNVHPPHDRAYRLRLRSRCACLGGCDSTVNASLVRSAGTPSVAPNSTSRLVPSATTPPVVPGKGRFAFHQVGEASADSSGGSSRPGTEDPTESPAHADKVSQRSTNLLTVGQKRYILQLFQSWKRTALAPYGGHSAEESCGAFDADVESCLATTAPPCEYDVAEKRCVVPSTKWMQVSSHEAGMYCNCTHVGGDAEKERPSAAACMEEAEAAGANVVNFVSSKDSAQSTATTTAPDQRGPARDPKKKTSSGCFYKKCSTPMLWSGRIALARYEAADSNDGLTGFDIHMMNVFVNP